MDRSPDGRRTTAPPTRAQPTHPTFVAAALMVGITLLLVLVAVLGTVR